MGVCVEWVMRRGMALLLVALFSFSLIAPAVLASDAASKVPACCRRDGKHHCTSANPSSGRSVRTAKCATFPYPTVLQANQFAGFHLISNAAAIVFFSHPASISRAETQSRISYSQAGQKRGPPALLS